MIKSVTVQRNSAWLRMSRRASDSMSMALTQSKGVNTSNLVVNKNAAYSDSRNRLVNVSNVFQIAHSLWIAFLRACLISEPVA